eukprot:1036179-Rhodomonas_salina.6
MAQLAPAQTHAATARARSSAAGLRLRADANVARCAGTLTLTRRRGWGARVGRLSGPGSAAVAVRAVRAVCGRALTQLGLSVCVSGTRHTDSARPRTSRRRLRASEADRDSWRGVVGAGSRLATPTRTPPARAPRSPRPRY